MRILPIVACVLTACGGVQAADTALSGHGVGSTGQHPAKGIVTTFCDYPSNMAEKGIVTGSFWGKSSKAPDTSFKPGEKKNIIWRTTLPHWGNNAPVKVKDKVFVLCNQGWSSDAPLLVCIDDKSGKILWQEPVDHLDAKGVSGEAKKARAKEIARYKEWMKWWNHCYFDNSKWNWARHTPDSYAPKREEAKAAGWEMSPNHKWPEKGNSGVRGRWGLGVNKRGGGSNGGMKKEAGLKENFKKCAQEGWHRYQGWGTEAPWYGSTHGSVASDGETIYAITALGGAAAFDLDGKRKWVTWLKVSEALEGGCDAWSTRSLASPSLAGDTLVFWYWNAPAMYGLDTKTGKILWKTMAPGRSAGVDKKGRPLTRKASQFERFGGHHGPGSSAAIVKVGDEYLAVAGHGMVVRVSDGKNLGWIPGGGRFYYTICAQGDTVYLPAPHTALSHPINAVKLGLDGDKLTQKVLWTTPFGERGQGIRSDAPNLIVDGDRLYAGNSIFDTATGKKVGSLKWKMGKYPAGLASSDKYLVTRTGDWSNKSYMTYQICDKQTGALVGEGFLGEPPPEGELIDRHIAFMGFPDLHIGCANLSAWGNRIYIRSNDYLWCIGK